MASPVGHFFLGTFLASNLNKKLKLFNIKNIDYIVYSGLLACSPDFDYFRIITESPFLDCSKLNHRQSVHSIFFICIVSIISACCLKLYKKYDLIKICSFIFIILGSHLFLDYIFYDNLAVNGSGIMIFFPFDKTFYFQKLIPIGKINGNHIYSFERVLLILQELTIGILININWLKKLKV